MERRVEDGARRSRKGKGFSFWGMRPILSLSLLWIVLKKKD